MPFLNNASKKSQLAYLTALTLLFSYAEMILPRTLPFFRLGLANIIILSSLEIELSSFLILSILKAAASSLMGGTLFSPFFLISLAQSFFSALVMRLAYKTVSKKLVSLYGISVLGSAVSALVQMALAGLYLGSGTFALLGPILIFNTLSGLLTAFLCEKLKIDVKNAETIQSAQSDSQEAANQKNTKQNVLQIIFLVFLLLLSASLFFIKNLYILAAALFFSLTAQKLFKRKIFILPHLSLWLFIFISSIFIPNGKVIFKIWNISVTQGALLLALQKSLTLSAVSALSQCAVCLQPSPSSLMGMSIEYYRIMTDRFMQSEGSLLKRIDSAF
ncbi:MAG: Gx transporter family protein [Treponema sp.]|nr:Gx transporter family protein [Treponema sp.]